MANLERDEDDKLVSRNARSVKHRGLYGFGSDAGLDWRGDPLGLTL